ncbi:MAG: DUF4203 domain-containing protein [Anaerolineales bacterium]|nr:DUF4203 domain-containing protein [Anaerolineales bacterium]
MPPLTTALRFLFGAALITVGRRLYWFFVAAVGFLVGLRAAGALFEHAPNWMVLALAVLTGLLSAGLAVLLQRFGVALAGLLAGLLAANALLGYLDIGTVSWAWVVYLVAGILGAVLLSVLFDWALIVLSSLVGAAMMVQAVEPTSPWNAILFLTALLLGVFIQGNAFRRPSRPGADT